MSARSFGTAIGGVLVEREARGHVRFDRLEQRCRASLGVPQVCLDAGKLDDRGLQLAESFGRSDDCAPPGRPGDVTAVERHERHRNQGAGRRGHPLADGLLDRRRGGGTDRGPAIRVLRQRNREEFEHLAGRQPPQPVRDSGGQALRYGGRGKVGCSGRIVRLRAGIGGDHAEVPGEWVAAMPWPASSAAIQPATCSAESSTPLRVESNR